MNNCDFRSNYSCSLHSITFVLLPIVGHHECWTGQTKHIRLPSLCFIMLTLLMVKQFHVVVVGLCFFFLLLLFLPRVPDLCFNLNEWNELTYRLWMDGHTLVGWSLDDYITHRDIRTSHTHTHIYVWWWHADDRLYSCGASINRNRNVCECEIRWAKATLLSS